MSSHNTGSINWIKLHPGDVVHLHPFLSGLNNWRTQEKSQFSAHSAEPPESSNSSGCSIQPLSGSNYVLSSAFLHALVLTPSVE
ncbi:hypothetical protein I305_05154 [Cryptococcus gattii E566]|uniref:Uncharacterized protein n=1 Tax=Cryptococcus gattii EJB2 TaxID=1296103 RepID=A0ABR5C491_9TREE|nr:hypothetical protein I306_00182 [Cryptococcus gattii EJB2]KIY32207.1 hypothetical protein I305_05154 [Cryptococcus gattii E566]